MSYFYNFGKLYNFHPDMIKDYHGNFILISENMGKVKMLFSYKDGKYKIYCYFGNRGNGIYEVQGWVWTEKLIWHSISGTEIDELFL